MLTSSTYITLLRILLLPFFIYLVALHDWILALCVFFIAAITDILDGAWARFFHEESVLGTYLDPIADKLFIISSYCALSAYAFPLLLPRWFIVIILFKELILVLGTLYVGLLRQTMVVKPSWLGKGAMLMQTFFVAWLLISLVGPFALGTGTILFRNIVFVMTLAALAHYSYAAIRGAHICCYLFKWSCSCS